MQCYDMLCIAVHLLGYCCTIRCSRLPAQLAVCMLTSICMPLSCIPTNHIHTVHCVRRYNSNVKHHNEIQETGMRDALEGMFLEAKVDLVFSGHVHAYERTFAVANNKTTAGAPIHINIGDAGNREGPCPDYFPQPEWSAFRESKFGHGEMAVHNSTHLQWNWHRVIDDEPVSADSVWLVKDSESGLVGAVGEGASAGVYDGYSHLLRK